MVYRKVNRFTQNYYVTNMSSVYNNLQPNISIFGLTFRLVILVHLLKPIM